MPVETLIMQHLIPGAILALAESGFDSNDLRYYLVGIKEQYWLGYPDAGEYDYFDVRRDLLRYIRLLKPDFVFICDPWLTYEGHRDHIQTGLATSEAVMFAGLTKIASSDPEVDSAYDGHEINGIAFYFTREPNVIADISSTWEDKIGALRCYEAQFTPEDMEQLVAVMEIGRASCRERV